MHCFAARIALPTQQCHEPEVTRHPHFICGCLLQGIVTPPEVVHEQLLRHHLPAQQEGNDEHGGAGT